MNERDAERVLSFLAEPEADPRRNLPSASSMYRTSQCPGWLALVASLKEKGIFFEPGSTADALSGRLIHRWLYLRALRGKEQADQLGLTPEQIRTGEDCERIRDEILSRYSTTVTVSGERRYWFWQGLRRYFSGAPDLCLTWEDQEIILNYKTGRVEEDDAPVNLQLRTEAVLRKANNPELKSIKTAVVQPWATHTPVVCAYGEEELLQATDEIVRIVNRTIWDRDTRVAGHWCKHCPASSWCNEAQDYLGRTVTTAENVEIINIPRGKLGVALYERISVARDLLDKLQYAFEKIVEAEPDALPGYRLKEGDRRRSLKDPTLAFDRLQEWFTHQQFVSLATFWVGKIEDHYVNARKAELSIREAKEEFSRLVGDLIEVTRGKPELTKIPNRKRKEALTK